MRYLYYTIVVGAISLLCIACKRDIVMKIDTFPHPSIVMNGELEADSVVKLQISKSIPVYINTYRYDESNLFTLENGTLKLFVNGELKEETKLKDVIGKRSEKEASPLELQVLQYRGKTIIHEGDKLRIEVSAPDMPTAYFQGTMPLKPQLEKVNVEAQNNPKNVFKYLSSQFHTYVPQKFVNCYAVSMKFTTDKQQTYQKMGLKGWMQHANEYDWSRSDRNTPGDYPAMPHRPKRHPSNVYYNMPIWTGVDPVFSKDCSDLMKYLFSYSSRLERYYYMIPYFNEELLGAKEGVVKVLIPFNVHPWRIALYNISEDYYQFATHHYGLKDIKLDDEENSDNLEIDEDSGLKERTPTFTNVKNGIGVVLMKSGTVYEYKGEKQIEP